MRLRRLALAAALLGAAAATAPTTASAQTLRFSQVDVAPDGAAVVVWNDPLYGTIKARRRAASGVLGPVRQISSPGTTNVAPRVGVDGTGVATIMWRKNTTGGSGVVQTRRLLTDSTLGTIIDVAPQSTPIENELAVSHNGVATFAWRDVDAVTQKDVVRVRQRVGVNALRALHTMGQPHYDDPEVDVATDPTGNATIAWTESGALTTRRLSSGGTFNAAVKLTAVDYRDATNIEVAVAPSGRATFAWSRLDDAWNTRIETNWRDPNGTVGTTVPISDAGQSAGQPQVAGDQDGDMTFVWEGTGDRAQTRTRFAGGMFSTIQTLSAAGLDVTHPKVDVSPTGIARFAWNVRTQFNSDAVVQTRRRMANGTLTTLTPLSAAGSHNIEQQVAVDPNGKAVVVWTRQRDATNPARLQLRAIDAAGNLSPTQNLE